MKIPGENYMGLDAVDLIELLVASWANVQAMSFARYRHPVALQEKLQANHSERAAIQKALELRSALGLPFWDSVMLSLFGVSDEVTSLLQRAKLHQDLSASTFWLSTSDIRLGALRELESSSVDLLGLRSEVMLSNAEVGHIPLLDFHCPSSKNLSIVVQVCKQLFNGRFFLLESGESYHAYGASLLSTDDLIDFLSSSLFYSPIVDRAYVAHQVRQRACLLRITNGNQKALVPKVVFVAE